MDSDSSSLKKELKETQDQLRAAKDQLRIQQRRARQLVAAFTVKLQDKDREMQMLRVLKDGQLQSIIRKLLHFESLLRQEQKKIASVVAEKDSIIEEQKKEIERLNRKLLVNHFIKEEIPESGPQHSAKVPKLQNSIPAEDKENKDHSRISETPIVTKMVRKFEVPAKKPEVPKKPARIAQLKPRPPVERHPAETSSSSEVVNGDLKTVNRGVSRKDSVNDHGYFTLEKRKPFKNGSGSVSSSKATVEDETDLRQNFEEFHLDSLEEEHPYDATNDVINGATEDRDRYSGDGAENKKIPLTPEPHNGTGISNSILIPQLGDLTPNPAPFDRFLEVTGLTQKSILTPSRMLSNHKNMLKPKDVKHRSRVKAAVLGSCRQVEEDPNLHSANHVRYYVEPFL